MIGRVRPLLGHPQVSSIALRGSRPGEGVIDADPGRGLNVERDEVLTRHPGHRVGLQPVAARHGWPDRHRPEHDRELLTDRAANPADDLPGVGVQAEETRCPDRQSRLFDGFAHRCIDGRRSRRRPHVRRAAPRRRYRGGAPAGACRADRARRQTQRARQCARAGAWGSSKYTRREVISPTAVLVIVLAPGAASNRMTQVFPRWAAAASPCGDGRGNGPTVPFPAAPQHSRAGRRAALASMSAGVSGGDHLQRVDRRRFRRLVSAEPLARLDDQREQQREAIRPRS
jgi:hypothetical protein